MLDSFTQENQTFIPNGHCVDGNGHVTSVDRVCYKCRVDLNK
jgi:hypothetical protein